VKGADGERGPNSRARIVTASAFLVALALVMRALHLVQSRRVALDVVLGAGLHVVRLGLSVAALIVVVTALREWRALRRGEAGSGVAGACWAFVVAVLAWLLFLWQVQPFQRVWLDLALGGAAGAWALVLIVRNAAARGHARLVRTVERTACALCIAVVGLELGLRAWASLRPTPLNARVGAAPRERIRRFRYAPGDVRFGFPFNSRGYYDDELEPARPGDERPRIVAIGDSFHVGMVPHAWHFTTLCEELLGARIDNIGVPGIGPPEYLSLLVEEALPLDPDLVLISVFVGNDLNVADVLAELPDPGLRAWLQRDQVLLFVLPGRLARLRAERARLSASEVAASPPHVRPMGRAEAARAFPWVTDPAFEEPSYTPETFLYIETTRALDVCTGVPPSFEVFSRSMLAARRAAGDVPLRVLIIPEEFQVEDALWQRVEARAGRALDRDAPQRLVTAWLAEHGIPSLDLLPVFRAVPPGPDGERHLYHLRDTHFNVRGNEVAARALADFLR